MWLPRLRDAFAARFGRPATVVARAPGRVNLLGEHTDYNDGFVLPVALRQCTWIAAATRDDDGFHLHASNLGESFERAGDRNPAPAWARYLLGVSTLLRERGARLGGFDALIDGNLPIASGLSSSAALTVGATLTLSALAGEALVANELIDLCCEVERRFAGVPCGIMDPSASLLGRADHALLLDCRDRRVQHVALTLGDCAFLVIDSAIPRRLADSEYARRREECGAAVEHFQRINRQVRALRDVTIDTVRTQVLQMPPLAAARALHVASENRRTLDGAEALRRGDLPAFGRLLDESHRSLRDDYEVSCPPIDALVALLNTLPGVLGARMTGAGFGGCVLCLAQRDAVPRIEAALQTEYRAPNGNPAKLYEVRAGPGAALELA